MTGDIIVKVRARKPLVHCITNYVTANDCANMLLACGASPIMADDPEEASEITAACDGLVLNTGTPSPQKFAAILNAGKTANRLGLPVILDPVGIGASAMRRNAVLQLMDQVRFAAVRGNAGEISALVHGTATRRGVDSDASGEYAAENAMLLARSSGTTVVMSGITDIVTDGKTAYRIFNGHPMMRSVTGTGCQLSALTGAFIAADPENVLTAALAAACAMGLCGEIAHKRLSSPDGSATYRNYIIDAVYNLTSDVLEEGARYEVFR